MKPGTASSTPLDTPTLGIASASQQKSGTRGGGVRPALYWGAWIWLALVQWLNLAELEAWYRDSETYRRVYRDPDFYLLMLWIWSGLFALAIGLQAMGWRRRRLSSTVVVISGAFVCFVIANVTLGIHKTCCG